MLPLIAQLLCFLLRKGSVNILQNRTGKRHLELSRCWQHCLEAHTPSLSSEAQQEAPDQLRGWGVCVCVSGGFTPCPAAQPMEGPVAVRGEWRVVVPASKALGRGQTAAAVTNRAWAGAGRHGPTGGPGRARSWPPCPLALTRTLHMEEGAYHVASFPVALHGVRVQGPLCCSRCPSALTPGSLGGRLGLLLTAFL